MSTVAQGAEAAAEAAAAARQNIGAGQAAAGMSLEEWSLLKNKDAGPAVSPFLQVPLTMGEPREEGSRAPNVPYYLPAVLVPKVLTHEECYGLIAAVPQSGLGYKNAKEVHDMYEDRVVHYRYLTNDKHLADVFSHRLRDFLPLELDGGKLWRINPAWRFVKYEEGGHQTAHIDGREPQQPMETPDGWVQSRLTVQVYLNGDYDGGELAFVQKGGGDLSLKEHREGDKEQLKEIYVLKPTLGDVMIFYQERLTPLTDHPPYHLLHEARDVKRGAKFACRTMVDYVFPTKEQAQMSNLKDDLLATLGPKDQTAGGQAANVLEAQD